jgi:tRNA(Ile)-lysidine synthase TilS/MesJ
MEKCPQCGYAKIKRCAICGNPPRKTSARYCSDCDEKLRITRDDIIKSATKSAIEFIRAKIKIKKLESI